MDDNHYRVDLDWLRAGRRRQRRHRGASTLRATVTDSRPGSASRKVDRWLAGIAQDGGDWHGRGGWSVTLRSRTATAVELDLTSGGEDVADSLQAAVDELEGAVLGDRTTISWSPQPFGGR